MAEIHRTFRFALDPNNQQRARLASHAGGARYAYNWGLDRVTEAMTRGRDELHRFGEYRSPLPSAMDLHRAWNVWKKQPGNCSWWSENSKCVYQEAFRDLWRGLEAHWNSRRGQRRGRRVRFPRHKRKGRARDAFRLTGVIRVEDHSIQLPRVGRLRTHERTDRLTMLIGTGQARVLSATVCRSGHRWHVSLVVLAAHNSSSSNGHGDTIGVDLGLITRAVLSDGRTVHAPDILGRELRVIRRLSRQRDRRCTGSRRHSKAVRRLARLHAQAADRRRDFLHRLTSDLAKNHGEIVVEDLHVHGLATNRRIARRVHDAAFGELRRQLAYKCEWYGATLIVADRFFASTQRCSECGEVRTGRDRVPLGQRLYRCPSCGLSMDRDLNAACNLAQYPSLVAAGSAETENACGGEVSPQVGAPAEETGTRQRLPVRS